jgi:hypothetical protein
VTVSFSIRSDEWILWFLAEVTFLTSANEFFLRGSGTFNAGVRQIEGNEEDYPTVSTHHRETCLTFELVAQASV